MAFALIFFRSLSYTLHVVTPGIFSGCQSQHCPNKKHNCMYARQVLFVF